MSWLTPQLLAAIGSLVATLLSAASWWQSRKKEKITTNREELDLMIESVEFHKATVDDRLKFLQKQLDIYKESSSISNAKVEEMQSIIDVCRELLAEVIDTIDGFVRATKSNSVDLEFWAGRFAAILERLEGISLQT